jgi:hypothetical protein
MPAGIFSEKAKIFEVQRSAVHCTGVRATRNVASTDLLKAQEMTKATKQKSIRFSEDVAEKVERLAVEEGRTFSSQVNWLLRTLLADRAFSKQRSQQHHAA